MLICWNPQCVVVQSTCTQGHVITIRASFTTATLMIAWWSKRRSIMTASEGSWGIPNARTDLRPWNIPGNTRLTWIYARNLNICTKLTKQSFRKFRNTLVYCWVNLRSVSVVMLRTKSFWINRNMCIIKKTLQSPFGRL